MQSTTATLMNALLIGTCLALFGCEMTPLTDGGSDGISASSIGAAAGAKLVWFLPGASLPPLREGREVIFLEDFDWPDYSEAENGWHNYKDRDPDKGQTYWAVSPFAQVRDTLYCAGIGAISRMPLPMPPIGHYSYSPEMRAVIESPLVDTADYEDIEVSIPYYADIAPQEYGIQDRFIARPHPKSLSDGGVQCSVFSVQARFGP